MEFGHSSTLDLEVLMHQAPLSEYFKHWEEGVKNDEEIRNRCRLPQTFPFIVFCFFLIFTDVWTFVGGGISCHKPNVIRLPSLLSPPDVLPLCINRVKWNDRTGRPRKINSKISGLSPTLDLKPFVRKEVLFRVISNEWWDIVNDSAVVSVVSSCILDFLVFGDSVTVL